VLYHCWLCKERHLDHKTPVPFILKGSRLEQIEEEHKEKLAKPGSREKEKSLRRKRRNNIAHSKSVKQS